MTRKQTRIERLLSWATFTLANHLVDYSEIRWGADADSRTNFDGAVFLPFNRYERAGYKLLHWLERAEDWYSDRMWRRYEQYRVAVPVRDIDEILSYMWFDEADDYENLKRHDEHHGHVFESMQRVKDWLDTQDRREGKPW